MDLLGAFALLAAICGLGLVALEIAIKAPGAFIEILQDSMRFAAADEVAAQRARPTPVPVPANDRDRLRAA
jgi:hypothetical protein